MYPRPAGFLLQKVTNGHLLIDLTQDWFKDQPINTETKSSLTQDIFALSEYKSAKPPGAVDSVQEASGQEVSRHVHVEPAVSNQRHGLTAFSDEEELIPDTSPTAVDARQDVSGGTHGPDAQDLGSNMHFVLPALVALSDHGRCNYDRLPSIQGGEWKEGWTATTQKWQTNSKGPSSYSHTGEIRLGSHSRPRSPRCSCTRPSLLGCSSSYAGRQRQPFRPERLRHVEGLLSVPPSHRIHTRFRRDGVLPTGGSLGSRRGDRHDGGEGQDQRPALGEREIEQQDMQCLGCGGIFESKAEEVGERPPQHDPQGKAWHLSSIYTADNRGVQESSEEARRADCGEEGSRHRFRLEQGGLPMREVDPVEMLGEDDEMGERCGSLSEDRKSYLMEQVDDFIGEVDKIYEELVGFEDDCWIMEICCPPDSRLVETFLKHNKKGLRIGLPAFDLSANASKEELKRMITKWKPALAWFSLPCGPYSQIQELFNENTPEKLERSLTRKRKSKRMIHNGLDVALHQLEVGGDLAWEWPVGNRGWNLPRVRDFWKKPQREGRPSRWLCFRFEELKRDSFEEALEDSDHCGSISKGTSSTMSRT